MLLQVLALAVPAGFGGLWWKNNNSKKQLQRSNELLKTWTQSDNNLDGNLQVWLSGLSDHEFKTLTSQLSEHCKNLGLQLDWLWGTQLTHPELKATLKETVGTYISSRRVGEQAKADAEAVSAYQALGKKPKTKANQALAHQLYENLTAAGVIPAATPGLLDGSKKKRRAHVLTSIHQAATDSPDAFHATLKQVLTSGVAAAHAPIEQTEAAAEAAPAESETP